MRVAQKDYTGLSAIDKGAVKIDGIARAEIAHLPDIDRKI